MRDTQSADPRIVDFGIPAINNVVSAIPPGIISLSANDTAIRRILADQICVSMSQSFERTLIITNQKFHWSNKKLYSNIKNGTIIETEETLLTAKNALLAENIGMFPFILIDDVDARGGLLEAKHADDITRIIKNFVFVSFRQTQGQFSLQSILSGDKNLGIEATKSKNDYEITLTGKLIRTKRKNISKETQ